MEFALIHIMTFLKMENPGSKNTELKFNTNLRAFLLS